MARARNVADMTTSLFDLISCALGGVMILMFVMITILDEGGKILPLITIDEEMGRRFSLVVTDTTGTVMTQASLFDQKLMDRNKKITLNRFPACQKKSCDYKIQLVTLEKRTVITRDAKRQSKFAMNQNDCLSVILNYEKGGVVSFVPGQVSKKRCQHVP
jgi:hypothetical protein